MFFVVLPNSHERITAKIYKKMQGDTTITPNGTTYDIVNKVEELPRKLKMNVLNSYLSNVGYSITTLKRRIQDKKLSQIELKKLESSYMSLQDAA